MIIPTLLGMFTTLVTLSIIIGPPTLIFTPPIPAELFIEGWNTSKTDGYTIVTILLSNPGDEGLFVHRVYANETEVVSRRIYIEPRSGIRDIPFSIRTPRRVSTLVVKIVWSPETGSETRETSLTIVVRP